MKWRCWKWRISQRGTSGYLLEITNKDFSSRGGGDDGVGGGGGGCHFDLWMSNTTLISYGFGECRVDPISSISCVFQRGFQLSGFNNMHERIDFFFFFLQKEFVAAILFFPLFSSPPLSAISKQSMANCLFNASSWILLKVRHTWRYPPQLPQQLPPSFFCSERDKNGVQIIKIMFPE